MKTPILAVRATSGPELPALLPLLHHTCSNGETHQAGWMLTSFKINGSLNTGNRMCQQDSGLGGWRVGTRKSHFEIPSPLLSGATSHSHSQGSSVHLTNATETKSVNVCEFSNISLSSLSLSLSLSLCLSLSVNAFKKMFHFDKINNSSKNIYNRAVNSWRKLLD